MSMSYEQFTDQVRGANSLSAQDARDGEQRRAAIGQVPIIRILPIRITDTYDTSFWRDVAGKARETDGIAPFSIHIDEKLIWGLALWRNIQVEARVSSVDKVE